MQMWQMVRSQMWTKQVRLHLIFAKKSKRFLLTPNSNIASNLFTLILNIIISLLESIQALIVHLVKINCKHCTKYYTFMQLDIIVEYKL